MLKLFRLVYGHKKERFKGYCFRKPSWEIAVCIPLTSANRRIRLSWFRNQITEIGKRLKKLWLSSFMSPNSILPLIINLHSYKKNQGPTTCPSPKIWEIDYYGSGGLIVWLGIMLQCCTPIHIFVKGSVTDVRYRYAVLEPYVRSWPWFHFNKVERLVTQCSSER